MKDLEVFLLPQHPFDEKVYVIELCVYPSWNIGYEPHTNRWNVAIGISTMYDHGPWNNPFQCLRIKCEEWEDIY